MRHLILFLTFVGWFGGDLLAADVAVPSEIVRFVAIDNVCAWPSLTRLSDGTIAAIIHNRPSHGGMAGDIECWASDDGAFWRKRGHPAPNDPHTIRMNHAFGVTKKGDLLVLCSGWTDLKQLERPKQDPFRDAVLRAWVCRSADGGRTWSQIKNFPAPEPGWTEFIPFGNLFVGEDDELHVSCYCGEFIDPSKSSKTKRYRSWHLRSEDADGESWRPVGVIGPTHNETALFPLGGRRWLAAARETAMDLFQSEDEGATWSGPQRVTKRNEINGHLTRLSDGRLLLSYGSRVKGQFGVLAKLSDDDGLTWSAPLRLANTLDSDCGYPSSVSRADGRIVTAYYAKRVENHDRYHMGVAIWEAPRKSP